MVSCTRQAVFIVTLSFANMSIMEEVGKIRAQRGGGRFVVENNPVGSSQSVIRKKPFSLHKASCELKLALEKRWGVQIATFFLNRNEVGHDGKTAYWD